MMWFLGGAIAGSAANAIIYRLPHGVSWWKGRSLCPRCKHPLAWYDLIPLFSFLSLRGKCRYCGTAIGIRYLLVELVMALGFAYLHTPLLAGLLFATVVIAVMDWESMLVSDWMVGIWLVLVLLLGQFSWVGLAVGVGLIGAIWAISKGKAMGFGDVEIAAVLGLWLGWPKTAYALWIAFVSGAAVGIWYLVVGKKKMKSRIAFGPFLILGSWLAFLIQWKYVLPF